MVRPLLVALLILLPVRLPAGQMVVFGDSLSDGGIFVGLRFTDPGGDLWHEYLADRLGMTRATTGFLGWSGLNLAIGGDVVADLQDQVNRYSTRYTWQSGDLCTLWIGGNDIRGNPSQNMVVLADKVGDIVAQLAALGVDNFFVPNLPDLGKVPESLGTPSAGARTAGTIAYNAALEAEMLERAASLGVTIRMLDVFSLFNNMLSNPGEYGFTNVTEPLENSGGVPEEYAFWDDIHPTTRAHYLLSCAAHVVLEPSAPPEIISRTLASDGTFRLTWLADPGLSYEILAGPDVSSLPVVQVLSGDSAYTVEVTPVGARGFYQMRVVP